MKRRNGWAVVFLLCLIPFSAHAAKLSLAEFQARMKAHLKSLADSTIAGVRIEVLGSGREIFSHNDGRQLLPASGAKLITSAAALVKLGPGFTFTTKVLQEGSDLILVGGGDPYLVSERLWLLARDVARSGIKTVGSIKINNSVFSEDYRGLTEFQESGEPFTAIVAGTSLNFNSLELHASPRVGQEHPQLDVGPENSSFATLVNEAQQVDGSSQNIAVRSSGLAGQKEKFTVTGSIGRQALPVVVYATVSRPEMQVAAAFAALLRKEGIAVASDFGGVSAAAPNPSAKVLAIIESLPLQDLVRLFNNYSNNFMAEEVFQALGAAAYGGPASVEKSRQAIQGYLHEREACAESRLTNGSGLAWDSQISTRCMLSTLQSTYRDFSAFADLLGSLPEGGQTGTLKRRFKHLGAGFRPNAVRAKTGTLWSHKAVSSLTGITSAASGEKVLFSLIENDSRGDHGLVKGMKDWEDQCVELLQELQL